MASSACTSEIVESEEEPSLVPNFNRSTTLNSKMKAGEKYKKSHGSSEEDLNRIIKAIDRRASSKVIGPLWKTRADLMRKNALKNPIEIRIPESPGIGISESVTLKQALRRLCISQASEMALTKRPPKPIGISGFSKSGTIKSPYASVVVKAGESGVPQGEGRDSLAEISLVPEKSTIISSSKETELCQMLSLRPSKKIIYSSHCAVSTNAEVLKSVLQDVVPSSTGTEDISSAVSKKITKGKVTPKALISGSHTTVVSCKRSTNPRMSKPVLRNKARVRKKGKPKPTAEPGNDSGCRDVNRVGDAHSTTKVNLDKRSVSPICSKTNSTVDVGKKNKDYGQVKLDSTPSSYKINRDISEKKSGSSSSRENGDYYQSSKSSNGDYSSSSSISCESRRSVYCNSSRPHMSKDVRWTEIHHVLVQNGSLGLMNFKLLKKLGFGDIGAVYLAELIGSECLFALKVMDLEYLVSRKKMLRAQTEREILQILDHPFLPTLYAHFVTDNLSCLVMEYCPGGDLHVLRQKQPGRSFSESAARFYVAEVLLALEYLHMLGVVYRDLKPENILAREDGHIMLSDFDLSLRCTVSPSLLISSLLGTQEPAKKLSGTCAENSCIVSCFTPRLLSTVAKTRKLKSEQRGQVNPLPQLVVEPTDARSDSFVGTHEYLAPEIIRGDGHGSAVDWWTFGIFLYELIFGRTPFKGPGNEETMANVVSQSLMFPENPAVSSHARDLIVRLLVKEPENRLGSMQGAAEIKQHPFFEGLSWALIRCALPPETPKSYDVGTPISLMKKETNCQDFRANEEYMEFELF